MKILMMCFDCHNPVYVDYDEEAKTMEQAACQHCGADNLVAVVPCAACMTLHPVPELTDGLCDICYNETNGIYDLIASKTAPPEPEEGTVGWKMAMLEAAGISSSWSGSSYIVSHTQRTHLLLENNGFEYYDCGDDTMSAWRRSDGVVVHRFSTPHGTVFDVFREEDDTDEPE